jgi:hypothetical protein
VVALGALERERVVVVIRLLPKYRLGVREQVACTVVARVVGAAERGVVGGVAGLLREQVTLGIEDVVLRFAAQAPILSVAD